jgi:hypothetical protein
MPRKDKGFRIRHRTGRRGLVTVEDPRRKYGTPYACPYCKTVHVNKTYHLELDDEGTRIVSPKILERLREIGAVGQNRSPFIIESGIKEPPVQKIGVSDGRLQVVRERPHIHIIGKVQGSNGKRSI